MLLAKRSEGKIFYLEKKLKARKALLGWRAIAKNPRPGPGGPHPAPVRRARRNVALLSDLRTTADEHVRIHHGSFVNVRSDVDKHRRHAYHAARHETAIADTGAPGN